MPKQIGVLALQGDFAEHVAVLRCLEVDACEVRLPQHLEGLDGIIIPGGESRSMSRLMDLYQLREPLMQRIRGGMPAWGTCAGMILLARSLTEDGPTPLGLMDIQVVRNAFGRQADSFEEDLAVAPLGDEPFHAVFIRAPAVCQVGDDVHVLAHLRDGRAVAAQQGHLLATAFHPELTPDTRFHRYFLRLTNASDGNE